MSVENGVVTVEQVVAKLSEEKRFYSVAGIPLLARLTANMAVAISAPNCRAFTVYRGDVNWGHGLGTERVLVNLDLTHHFSLVFPISVKCIDREIHPLVKVHFDGRERSFDDFSPYQFASFMATREKCEPMRFYLFEARPRTVPPWRLWLSGLNLLRD